MRLKQIQMQGFKSFVNRTVLDFNDNISLVVGPNGCGKSNIVDAIRWTMGEQSAKHMRGESMEDVIFHGTDEAQPVGMAEVILTFDNSEGLAPGEYSRYSEIQVCRRLFRSGESEYYINRTPCRLKDITDLFLGSGAGTKAYSIIQQGRIEEIITMKPDQRRTLIEEAAGVSKYRARKIEAQRKMESTRQNLTRLRDIISELSRQMNSLNRQAKKAERYKKYKDELKSIELELAAFQGFEYRKQHQNATETMEELKNQELEVNTALEKANSELESRKEELAQAESDLKAVQEKANEASRLVEREENALAMKNQEKKSLEETRQRLEEEKEDMARRLAATDKEISEVSENIRELESSAEAEKENLQQAEEKKAGKEKEYREMTDAVKELEKKAQTVRSEVDKLKERIEWASVRKEELEEKKDRLEKRIEKQKNDLEAKGRENLAYNEKLYQVRKDISSLKQEIKEEGDKLQKGRDEKAVIDERLRKTTTELQKSSSRLESLEQMEKNFEGYHRGVKSVMERKKKLEAQGQNGTYGLITDSIKVDPDYELALEAVLGERLQSVVVKNTEHGLDNIKYLQQENAGRSSFIAMENARTPEPQVPAGLREAGAELLCEKISGEDRFVPLVKNLVGDALVVEDIEPAARLLSEAAARNTLVTRDGVLLDGEVLVGGSKDSFGGILSKKREIEELRTRVDELSHKKQETEDELQKVESRIRELESQWEQKKEKAHKLEIERNNVEKDLRQGTETYNSMKEEIDSLEMELQSSEEGIHKLESEAGEHSSDIEKKQAELDKTEKERERMEAELSDLRQGRDEAREAYTEIQVRAAALKEKLEARRQHLERLTKTREEIEAGIQKRTRELTSTSERLEELASEIEEVIGKRQEAAETSRQMEEKVEEKRADYEAKSQSLTETESDIKEKYRQKDNIKNQIMETELSISQLQMKWDSLAESVRDRCSEELEELLQSAAEPAPESFPLEEKREKREDLKNKLHRMGEVNLTAIEEFQEISERHSFLSNQEGDLIQALDNLEVTIGKINSAYRRAFKKTFEEVNNRFQEVFPRLFNGGKAYLQLTNTEDILETGVEILAQPPGKKLYSIALLSGGEKALTASALIISLFQVKPSPFCVLDEVDAALDEVNIARFKELIYEMAERSQLILVTHNQMTMDIANSIYGVTMEKKGVSKLVSVRFQEGNGHNAAAANS
ncbi:MAG: chromosome segregation protein SMC [bacterium]